LVVSVRLAIPLLAGAGFSAFYGTEGRSVRADRTQAGTVSVRSGGCNVRAPAFRGIRACRHHHGFLLAWQWRSGRGAAWPAWIPAFGRMIRRGGRVGGPR